MTIMQVAGLLRRKRWQYGVSIAAFFRRPPKIGPRMKPREKTPIVEQFFVKNPEEIHNVPRQITPWERPKPLGHLYKENPHLLKQLRDNAIAQLPKKKKPAAAQNPAPEPDSAQAQVSSTGAENENVDAGQVESEEKPRPPPLVVPKGGFLPLWNLPDNPYARKKNVKRLGRGIGSGKGKTCGRGHKGQKARAGCKPRLGFEGGQTPVRLRLPKKYASKSPFEPEFKELSLERIKTFIEAGKIDPSKLITMKTLHDTRCCGKYIKDGVLIVGKGQSKFDIPIHLEVSRCTVGAKMAIEEAGGTVRKVHYNKLGLKALCDPFWFKKKGRLLPRAARPKPKIAPLVDAIGRLPAPLSPILPPGFVLKAPVHGHPWPPPPPAEEARNSNEKDS